MFQQITKSEFNLTALMDIEYKHNYSNNYNIDDDGSRKLRFHELRYGKEYDKIKNLTEEVLRKLFPVCNRFYLKKYDRYEDKGNLRFENNDGVILPISKEFAKIIGDFRDTVIEMHKKNMPKSFPESPCEEIIKKKEDNFKLFDSEKNDISNPIYLSFLGIYPRDIVSNYYTLNDTLLELKHELKIYYQDKQKYKRKDKRTDDEKENDFISRVYDICINFIHSIITSNRNLKPFCKESYDLILKQKLHYSLFVNYEMINNVMCKKEYFANNKENPDYFLEMFSLLNFVEQLIVLVIPERKSSHGHAEFKIFLDKCDIKIIKQSDDLDKMLTQYFLFQSSNILHFNISNPLHRDAFVQLVNKLELFDEKNTQEILIEDKNWYDLCVDVVFYAFSNISVFEKNKSRFFIFEEMEFMDTDYEKMSKDYYSELHKWIKGGHYLVSEVSNVKNKKMVKERNDFIKEFLDNAFNLNEYLNNITIQFESKKGLIDDLFSFRYELSHAEGLNELKRLFNNFTETLEKNDYTLNRTYVTQTLKSMRNSIKVDDYEDFPYIFSWLRRLKFSLKQNFKLVHDENYNNYFKIHEYIISSNNNDNNNMKTYIDYLIQIYLPDLQAPGENNPLKDLMQNSYYDNYISNLFEREWRKLRGLE